MIVLLKKSLVSTTPPLFALVAGRCCGRSGAAACASAAAWPSGGGLAGDGLGLVLAVIPVNAGLARFDLAGLAQAKRKVVA